MIMESTVPVVRFVKCPKCLKILTEFAEFPVYKCGGCGTILKAKVHSSSGQNSTTVSADPASQKLADIDTSSNKSVNFGEETNIVVSESNHKIILMEMRIEQEQTEINNALDSKGSMDLEDTLKVNPEVSDSLKSSDDLNEPSETVDHSTTSEEDISKTGFANETHSRMSTRGSSCTHNGSASSTDEDMKDNIPRKYFLSRTHQNKYVSDSICSREEAGNSIPDIHVIEQDYTFASQGPFRASSYPTKDAQVKISQISSEQEDQEKILNKVDELRNELRGLFNKAANDNAFIGKVPSKEFRYSLIPFSRHYNSHFCSHPCEAGARPFNIQTGTINQGQQDLQHKFLRSQPVVRLCRPISGGAPFVICYQCFKLLQLPVDFLVSPKKIHKLRCGACLQVLLFSFRPRSHSISQTPEEFQHPPSEENENLVSQFENTAWDQISTSEGSFFSLASRNFSEVETALNKSRSFDGIVEELGIGGDIIGSKLHTLLGYSSARELLFNTDYSYDSDGSIDSGTPSFYRPSGRRRWGRH